MIPLVLASASPARLATLRAAGIDPVVRVSGVDEHDVLTRAERDAGAPLTPAQAVLTLAGAKARAVAGVTDLPTGLVLGCDSLLELDGDAFGKPRDAADAVQRWRRMRGRSGVLHTGHWLVDRRGAPGRRGAPCRHGAPDRHPADAPDARATSSTVVHFADLTDAEIEAYVATTEPLAVAGAFTIDGLGGPFVRGIEGDHHGVVGLSLPVLRDLLRTLGLTIPELWRTAG